ncbi:insecticidal delta-endotoxin Cry8Ea1 family protein [Bacillus thuringiensis]|uniref:insecticidal delta-endotoxin Cry8Ea1 family protein n=1 Tax=Bacillus thuringiensis TaxID=1428 RepID=UPI001EE05F4F|nr:insecticidal delta-endotoxin Cry8Ea1 family protein [Bacillus thuringiensis]MCG3426194.1 hypothetical protein [Bacillus thuringiensis]
MNSNIQNSIQQLENIAKFPLSFDPIRHLSGMNYKDCLANNGLDLIKPSEASALNATTAILGSSAAVLSLLLAPPITVGGVIVAAFSTLSVSAPFFWPVSGENNMNELVYATEDLLEQRITETIRTIALGVMNGFHNSITYYNAAFSFWVRYPTSDTPRLEVLNRFQRLHGDYVMSMSMLALSGYEELLLPLYAQAAFQHLQVLSDGIRYADKWKLAKDDYNYGDLHYAEFQHYMEVYTNHCNLWYRNGLIRSNSTSKNWAEQNEYIRYMTLWVLDTVALFQNLNPRLYPNAVKTQTLSRKIYSPPINFVPADKTSDTLNFTTKPDLYANLNALNIYSNSPVSGSSSYVLGIENRYNLGGGAKTISKLFGQSTNFPQLVDFQRRDSFGNYQYKDLYRLILGFNSQTAGRNLQNLCKMEFYGVGPDVSAINPTFEYKTGMPANYHALRDLPPLEDTQLPHLHHSHDLSDVIIAKTNPDNTQAYSIAWTHKELDWRNYITDTQILTDETTGSQLQIPLITQIPATNAYNISKTGQIAQQYANISVTDAVKFTGGNLVLCELDIPANDQNTFITYFDIDFGCVIGYIRNNSFRIRIRYASNIDCNASFIGSPGYATVALKNTFNSVTDISRLNFGNFAFVESTGTFGVSQHMNLSIDISNPTVRGKNVKILIDKIELVPYR